MATDKRQMVLFSGGGWHYRSLKRAFLMDEWLLALTKKRRPRVCLLATPQGDNPEQLSSIFKQLGGRCELTWAPMFSPLPDEQNATDNLLGADLIYATGGYAQGSVGALRAAGWDLVLRQAWEDGVIIAGMCAGAMTFTRGFANRWMNKPGFGQGLGFQPVTFTAHAQHELYEPVGSLFRHGIRDGLLDAGYQLQDGFCLRFAGTRLVECVTVADKDPRGWLVEPSRDSEQLIVEHELHAERLEDRLQLDKDPSDPDFYDAMQAMDTTERRRRLRTPLERVAPLRRSEGEVTASIASPPAEQDALAELPDEAGAPPASAINSPPN